MDKDIEVVTLEDNCDYVILMEVSIDDCRYMVLSKEDDVNAIIVRKIIYENNNEYLEEVDTDMRNKVMEKFVCDFVTLE